MSRATRLAIFRRDRAEGVGGDWVECRALGMVSKTDLLEDQAELFDAYQMGLEFPPVGPLAADVSPWAPISNHTAGEAMSAPLLTVGATESVARAASMLATRCVHRLGVTDEAGRLVGVISTSDVVRWLASR